MNTISNPTPQDGGKQEHSPLPWKARKHGNQYRAEWRIDAPGWQNMASVVCTERNPNDKEAEANAAFIVSSVNSIAGMREANKELVESMQWWRKLLLNCSGPAVPDDVCEATRRIVSSIDSHLARLALTPPQENKA